MFDHSTHPRIDNLEQKLEFERTKLQTAVARLHDTEKQLRELSAAHTELIYSVRVLREQVADLRAKIAVRDHYMAVSR